MALFLESVEIDTTPALPLEEAYQGLLETVAHYGELTEAILTADFTIHEQTRGLEESVILEAEQGFFARVAAKVVEFIKKVRDKVVAFFKSLGEHIKALWAKLTGRGESISVPKGGAAGLSTVGGAFDKFQAAVASNATGKEYKRGLAEAEKEYAKVSGDVKKAITNAKASKSFESVKVSALNKIQATANTVMTIAGKTKADLDKQVQVAEKAKAKAEAASTKASAAVAAAGGAKKAPDAKVDKADDAKGDLATAKAELAHAREKAAGWSKLASAAGVLSATITMVVAGRADAPAK